MQRSAHDLRFELPSKELERHRWEHNEHIHGSLTPLAQDMDRQRARYAPDGSPMSVFVNGYSYSRPFDGFGRALPDDAERVVVWEDVWLPRIAAAAEQLEQFDPASVPQGGWQETIEAQVDVFHRTFLDLHTDTIAVVLPAAEVFIEGYVALLGEQRRDDAMATLQGHANESSWRAAALWALSRVARRDPQVRSAVEAGRVPDADSPAAREFRDALDGLLERAGYLTNMHLEDLPTWSEDPSRPLAMVAARLPEDEAADPELAEQRFAARRERLEQELDALAAEDRRARDLFEVLRIARNLVPASENHNALGDHRLLAASRVRWLRVGALLLERGLLGDPGDVFYHRLEEVIGLLEGEREALDLADIEARRRDQALWRSVVPPSHLGATESAPSAGEIRGIAASAGTYRGTARVIASLDEAARLEPGDVLVCSATAPEWTAYFGVAGALVIDVGGMLTHGAIVAREFGIPAVVGAGGATERIPDGATVTVDGAAGVVTIDACG